MRSPRNESPMMVAMIQIVLFFIDMSDSGCKGKRILKRKRAFC